MSQPKRYRDKVMPGRGINWQGFDYVMIEDDTGPWVSHSDYAALAAENERLRKAGDELYGSAQGAGCSECEGMYNRLECALDAWLAAKEGRDAK